MEITTVASFLDYYQKIKSRTDKVVRLASPTHMEFRYNPDKFSCGDLIRHIATIERFMYAEIVDGRHSSYRGCGQEIADGYEDVMALYQQLREESMAIFCRLTDEDLQKKCMTPDGLPITVWKWLRAMIEHEIHHRGQLYTSLGLLGIATPPIFGLTAEEVEERSHYKT